MSKLTTVFLTLLVLLTVEIGVLRHNNGKLNERISDLDSSQKSAETITKNVLTTVTLFNQISEANQNAKAQDALESKRAENDIKAAVANDDCANRLIPPDAVKRLREYADGIRSSSGDPATF
ncbi:DUF2570 domain-containing protein [Obesumbacterium proteus]|uniref:DUF2570 domain-containing protein n=1 Tax=Obesumbacterium proteus TaxID=82983 RepID=UPI001F1E13DC|nr:DUF2570 domain-containing protein [Obesumbacterium proteus]MCE9886496.1 DUF2570 domain-containing protein [Obesumbacterium proteus]